MTDSGYTLQTRLMIGTGVFDVNTPESERQKKLEDLQKEIGLFEIIFVNELQSLSTFFVSQKGTHLTSELLENAVNNPSEKIRSNLSADAIVDINAVGKCLAFEVPTAAGFHILRAVESLMRDYHFKLTSAPMKIKARNWGAFITALAANGADSKITSFLTHIREYYRNPIVHPEEVLTMDEAFSLFNASLSAITMLDAAIYPES